MIIILYIDSIFLLFIISENVLFPILVKHINKIKQHSYFESTLKQHFQ
jgi:hypothetical protein